MRSTCSRVEEGRVALPPVDHEDRPPGRFGDRLAEAVDLIGVVGIDLDRGHVRSAVEIGLRLSKRHEHEGAVIFRHTDLEHRGDLVGLDARRRAHRRHRAARRDQREAVAGAQRQLVGEPAADRDALPVVEAFQGSLLDVVGDRRQLVEIVGADTAHEHAGGVERRRTECLPIDHRSREANALDGADALGDLFPVRQRAFQRLHEDMAVEAEDLAEQFFAEAVHDGHHDD